MMGKLRSFNMNKINNNTLFTVVILAIIFLIGFCVKSCDNSSNEYRQNIYKIESMKIPDEAKTELAKKLTDDYIARKKK